MRAGATQPLPQGQGRGDMCCWGSAWTERWYGMDQTLACPMHTTHPSSSQVALLGHYTLKPLQAWPSNHALVAHFLRSRQQETPQPTHQHSTASHQSCILASSIGVPGAHGSMSRGPQRCAVGLSGALATKTPMCSTDGVFVPAGVVQVCPAHTSPPAGAAPLEGCHNNPTHCTVSEGCVRLGIGCMGACIPLWMLPLLPSPACPYIKPQQPELHSTTRPMLPEADDSWQLLVMPSLQLSRELPAPADNSRQHVVTWHCKGRTTRSLRAQTASTMLQSAPRTLPNHHL